MNLIEVNRIRNHAAIAASTIQIMILETCTIEEIAASPYLSEAMK